MTYLAFSADEPAKGFIKVTGDERAVVEYAARMLEADSAEIILLPITD